MEGRITAVRNKNRVESLVLGYLSEKGYRKLKKRENEI